MSNRGDTGLRAVHATRDEEYAAFDALPHVLKEAIRTASFKCSPISVRKFYRGHGLKRTLIQIAKRGREAHYHNYPELRETTPTLTLHLDL